MDFSLTAQQIELQQSVRKFATNELPGVAREIEENDAPPDEALLKRYAGMGLLGVNLPKQYGGLGLSHLDAFLVLEEIAKFSVATAFPIFESSFGPALAILKFAPRELKESPKRDQEA